MNKTLNSKDTVLHKSKNGQRRFLVVMLACLCLMVPFTSFAQSADANFVPKDPATDNLLTAENTVLLVVDWQQDLIDVVHNIDQDVMMNNVKAIVKTASLFGIPTIETTIGVKMAGSPSTVNAVKELLDSSVKNIDRVSLNAWQNSELVDAVNRTGRKKILMTGLWTSGCPTYTTLDAIKDGYEVYILTDVMGDATTVAHNQAISRMVQAGAIPFTWEGAGAEILRSYTNPKAFSSDSVKDGFVGVMKEHFYPFAGKY